MKYRRNLTAVPIANPRRGWVVVLQHTPYAAQLVPIQTLRDAQRAWNAYRKNHAFGARDLTPQSGLVRAPSGETVYQISYNGKAWEARNGKEVQGEALGVPLGGTRRTRRNPAGRAWRKSMGPMPPAVRDALIRSSREDLGDAWHRVDAAAARASGERRWSYNAAQYLRDEGLSPEQVATVMDWMWPPRKNPTARRVKPLTQAQKAVKLVEAALKAGVILHFSSNYYDGTAGIHHRAVGEPDYAIFRYSRIRGNRDDYYPTAFGTADHLVEFIGAGNVITALKAAARKAGTSYVNLDTPISWSRR